MFKLSPTNYNRIMDNAKNLKEIERLLNGARWVKGEMNMDKSNLIVVDAHRIRQWFWEGWAKGAMLAYPDDICVRLGELNVRHQFFLVTGIVFITQELSPWNALFMQVIAVELGRA